MKNTIKRIMLTVLALVLTAAFFAGCSSHPAPDATEKPDSSAAGLPDAQKTDGSRTADPTGAPADATAEPSDPPATDSKPEVTDGMMLYYEDFSSYENMSGAERIAGKLNWDVLSSGGDGAPSDWTADLAIEDGRLVVTNYWPEEDRKGNDSYVEILDRNYMKRAWEHGAYTLQYDVTYTAAANYKRYINIVTEYSGRIYNSYHFRIAGYGNDQIYYETDWLTYDIADSRDLFAAQKTTGDGFTTIAKKLLDIDTPVNNDAAIDNFRDVTVTIRIVRSKTYCAVYMKTADMTDFVQVSVSSAESGGYPYMALVQGWGVTLKAGGAINGYVDNIAIWTGDGEMPEDHTVNYVP